MKKLMHCIWIGDETKRPDNFLKTWQDKHPKWKYKIWGNEEVYGRKWKNQRIVDHYTNIKKYPGVADVIRYEILYEEGGFMHPADSICLHPIDELFTRKYNAYAVYENEKVRPGLISPLYGCTKGNIVAEDLIKALSKIRKFRTPWQTTGNLLMKKVVEAGHYPKLKIFPSHTFTPIHYTGETYTGEGKLYSIQQWGSTTEGGIGIQKYRYPAMDVVYVIDKRKPILELSIKTLKNIDYRRLFFVEGDDTGTPFENIKNKLRKIIKNKEISEDFILMNDDFLILQEYKDIPYYHKGYIKDYKPNDYWKSPLKELYKKFPEGKMFNVHFPIVYNKKKLARILNQAKGSIRTYYCNYYDIKGEQTEDYKTYQKSDIKKYKDAPFLSTTDTVEHTRLRELEKLVAKRL